MNLFKSTMLIAAGLCMGLTSCSSDEPVINGSTENDGDLYATIHLRLPVNSRSTTNPDDENYDYPENVSSDGFEYGQTYENNVNDVTIVLATYDDNSGKYTPVAVSTSSAVPDQGYTNENPVFNIRFRNDEIVAQHDQTLYIFAFCNAQAYLANETDFTAADFVDKIMSISSAEVNQGIWANGNFLMANAPNARIQAKVMPGEDDLKKNYNTADKALDLGTVEVARVVSRFDFKQTNDNKYAIKDANDADITVGNVELLAMAPLNIAKEFYLLPRVSNDGTDAGWNLCGNEYNTNWVVSPYWDLKAAAELAPTTLAKYFYQAPTHAYTDDTYFKYTSLSALASAQDDDDNNWGSGMSNDQKSGYKIWRYVTENTLPSTNSQRLGISTGIVFKAEITGAPAESVLGKAMATGKDIYSYNGTFYGTAADLRKVACSVDENNPLYKAFVKVFGASAVEKDEDGEFVVADDALTCTSAQNDHTFKIYRADNDAAGKSHYYVYYTYRNRHNNNGNNNVMGAMEFGTVRNNIYKLAVTSISDFGHTGDPGDDPDPENPEDPDEDPKTYLKVSCRVVPWVVRVNNIEF